nr:hypothetical protein [Tanacetum cinerariifolium]
MHVANTTAATRCLALEAELANLRETNNQDNQKELINHFSKLKAKVQPSVLTRTKHAVDIELIVPRLRNNRDAHLDYLRHLKESVETIRDIVEEAKVVKPLDKSIVSVCRYTKHSQELLEYAIGTCPHGSQPRIKQIAHIPLIKKKQVIVAQPSNKLDSTTHPHVVTVTSLKTNVPVTPLTGVDYFPIANGSQPMSHVKPNRISPAKCDTKLQIDDQPRKNKSHLRTSTRFDSRSRLKRTIINSHSDSVCQTCTKCFTLFNHDLCVATCLQSAMATPSSHYNSSVERKVKQVWKPKQVRQVWKPTRKVLTTIGHQWRPTCRIFELGNQCPLTKVVSATQHMKRTNTMTDVTAPTSQAPTMAPRVYSNDQSLLRIRWVQTGYLKFSAKWVFNSLVHSLRALSALRCFGLRTASTAAKPCQGDSSKFYLITGSIHTDQRGTVVLATLFNESEQRHFRSFTTNINLQESRRLQLLAKKDVNSQLHAHSSKLIINDSKKTYNTTFATLMYVVMIQDRVSMRVLMLQPHKMAMYRNKDD